MWAWIEIWWINSTVCQIFFLLFSANTKLSNTLVVIIHKKSFKICQSFCIEIALKDSHVACFNNRQKVFVHAILKLCIRDASGFETGYPDFHSLAKYNCYLIRFINSSWRPKPQKSVVDKTGLKMKIEFHCITTMHGKYESAFLSKNTKLW